MSFEACLRIEFSRFALTLDESRLAGTGRNAVPAVTKEQIVPQCIAVGHGARFAHSGNDAINRRIIEQDLCRVSVELDIHLAHLRGTRKGCAAAGWCVRCSGISLAAHR
jgi:hypothetical protein